MSSDPFQTPLKNRIKQAQEAETLDGIANAIFGPTADKYSEEFSSLQHNLKQANMDVLFRTYLSKMFLFSTLAGLAGIILGLVYVGISSPGIPEIIQVLIGLPAVLFVGVFGLFLMIPTQKARSRSSEIESNLPFAMNHLSAIATSGVPPTTMFDLLKEFDEYGPISEDAEDISRRVNVYGQDLGSALEEVASQTPSEEWADVLYGILSTSETGGDLDQYIKQKADESLFEFKMQREEEIEKINTYASFYTAIMIAAPVFLIVVLAIMNLLGGTIMGFQIRTLMWGGVHVAIPGVNIAFLLFLQAQVD